MAPITLGEHAIVSQGSHLCSGTHDIDDQHFQLQARPIVIGAHAWVAAEAFVGPGVTIGEAAVLGARAVLFKNAEPYGVCTWATQRSAFALASYHRAWLSDATMLDLTIAIPVKNDAEQLDSCLKAIGVGFAKNVVVID